MRQIGNAAIDAHYHPSQLLNMIKYMYVYIYIYNISKKICARRIQELQQLLSRIMIRVSKGFLASDSNSPRG